MRIKIPFSRSKVINNISKTNIVYGDFVNEQFKNLKERKIALPIKLFTL